MRSVKADNARHLLSITDLGRDEIAGVLSTAQGFEAIGEREIKKVPTLRGRTVVNLFYESSTRTRVSFEVGTWQLGGHALFLSPRDVQLGRGEPIPDTARVLSRYVDGIMIRTFGHNEVEELARFSGVPIINGLTDLLHPCQVLADLLTVRQQHGTVDGAVVAWIGDGNNMANSWINAAYTLGFELRLACPEGYDPNADILKRAQTKAQVSVVRRPSPVAVVFPRSISTPRVVPRSRRSTSA